MHNHTLPHLTLPYPTLPNFTLPYLILLYFTLPYITLPYLILLTYLRTYLLTHLPAYNLDWRDSRRDYNFLYQVMCLLPSLAVRHLAGGPSEVYPTSRIT